MNEQHSPEATGPLPTDLLLLSILLMVALHELVPIVTLVAGPLRLAGAVPIIAGLALNIWVGRLFKRAGTAVKPVDPSVALVLTGPFRISRNPMYLGMALALAGIAIGLGTASPWVIVPAFVWQIRVRFIVLEESRLEACFGQQFLGYKASVRRWL